MCPCSRLDEPGRGCLARSLLAPEAVALAAQSEPCDDGAIASVVLLDQIRKKASSLSDELEEAAAGLIVFRKAGQMRIQLLDPCGQERDLNFCRACIAILDGVFRDDLILRFPRERHTILRVALCDWGFLTSLNAWRMLAGIVQLCQSRGASEGVPPREDPFRRPAAPRPEDVRVMRQVTRM